MVRTQGQSEASNSDTSCEQEIAKNSKHCELYINVVIHPELFNMFDMFDATCTQSLKLRNTVSAAQGL